MLPLDMTNRSTRGPVARAGRWRAVVPLAVIALLATSATAGGGKGKDGHTNQDEDDPRPPTLSHTNQDGHGGGRPRPPMPDPDTITSLLDGHTNVLVLLDDPHENDVATVGAILDIDAQQRVTLDPADLVASVRRSRLDPGSATVNGVPAPGAWPLIGLAALLRRRRRRPA